MNKKIFLPLMATLLLFSCGETVPSSEEKKEISFETGFNVLEKGLKNIDSFDKVGLSLDIDTFKFHTYSSNVSEVTNEETSETVDTYECKKTKIELEDFSFDVGVSGLTTATKFEEMEASFLVEGDISFSSTDSSDETQNFSFNYEALAAAAYLNQGKLYLDGSNSNFARFLNEMIGSEVPSEQLKIYMDAEVDEEVTFPLLNENAIDNTLTDEELNAALEVYKNLDLSKYGDAFKMYQQGNDYFFEFNITPQALALLMIDIEILNSEEGVQLPTSEQIQQMVTQSITLFQKMGIEKMNFVLGFSENGLNSLSGDVKVAPRISDVNPDYEKYGLVDGDTLFELDFSIDFIYGSEVKIAKPESFEGYLKVEENQSNNSTSEIQA